MPENKTSGAKIALGSDHAGFELKEKIKNLLASEGFEVQDFGTYSADSCDYPDYARAVADDVGQGKSLKGILCCGSGIGVSIVANKVRNVRAALCHDEKQAELSRQHNDSNVLCLAARSMKGEDYSDIIKTWLATPFEGGRHQKRVEKIEKPRSGEKNLPS